MSASMKSFTLYNKLLFWQRLKECKSVWLNAIRSKSNKYGGKLQQEHKLQTSSNKGQKRAPVQPFREIQSRRSDEARRSVLFNVKKTNSEINSLLDICNSCGVVQNVFHYCSLEKDYLLVEFQHKDNIHKLFRNVGYFRNEGQMRVKSRLLYKLQESQPRRHATKKLPSIQYNNPVRFNLKTLADKKLTLSEEIKLLYNAEKITELDTRLRFFIASTVEELISNTFPYCTANLFGSCVNGFGNTGCDLDIAMDLTCNNDNDDSFLLKFLTQQNDPDPRRHSQQLLDVIGGMVKVLMPSTGNVQKILRARVPIIKFHHFSGNIECDITAMSNGSGVKMAELLFTWGELCPQIRPLVTVIKHWAKAKDLTQSDPGSWISNFMLIMMAVFYLQNKSMIPSFKYMQEIADSGDKFILNEINYSFCTDLRKLNQNLKEPDLGELLMGFFSFYSTFNFQDKAVSVVVGKPVDKSSDYSLYIENPLDVEHNVSKNVSETYLNEFVLAVQEGNSILSGAKSHSVLNDLVNMNAEKTTSTSSFNISSLFSNKDKNIENSKTTDIERNSYEVGHTHDDVEDLKLSDVKSSGKFSEEIDASSEGTEVRNSDGNSDLGKHVIQRQR